MTASLIMAGNLKKLVILKADQNQLLHLPATISQFVFARIIIFSLNS